MRDYGKRHAQAICSAILRSCNSLAPFTLAGALGALFGSGTGASQNRTASAARLLAIHETGHLVFAPFGEFLGFLGGTLFQLLFPLLFYGYFLRQQDRFAASVLLWWVAQNLWNISVYMADARAQGLPLVGGGEHDWAYLLGRMGLLEYDQTLANAVQLAGALLFFWAMLRAFQYSTTSEGAQKAALPQL